MIFSLLFSPRQVRVSAAFSAPWSSVMLAIHPWSSSFSLTPFWVLPSQKPWDFSVWWWPSCCSSPSKARSFIRARELRLILISSSPNFLKQKWTWLCKETGISKRRKIKSWRILFSELSGTFFRLFEKEDQLAGSSFEIFSNGFSYYDQWPEIF